LSDEALASALARAIAKEYRYVLVHIGEWDEADYTIRDGFLGGPAPVWETPDGDAVGPAYAPLYPTVPRAARADRALYDRLALFDLARGGRLRERAWAREQLEAAL
ncbi:MAG: hypothetical protein II839_02385, partial [Kiritimatiellae bacterium]|nr:hypothetical protein [Kiritimatiellia bacterium]